MAKERFITRTIKTTEAIVLGMDTVTCEPFNEAVVLAGTYGSDEKSQKKMLADAKAKIETEDKAVVKIVGVTEKETLYKVKEEDFMKIAQVV